MLNRSETHCSSDLIKLLKENLSSAVVRELKNYELCLINSVMLIFLIAEADARAKLTSNVNLVGDKKYNSAEVNRKETKLLWKFLKKLHIVFERIFKNQKKNNQYVPSRA